MLSDLRRAARILRKSPIFALTAIVTLAFAIAANTTVFGLLNAIVLRDIPVREPHRLVILTTSRPGSSFQDGLTFPMFEALQRQHSAFSSMIGWSGVGVFNIQTDREETHGACVMVSGRFFSELGVNPLRGRLLTDEDVNEASINPAFVAVISASFWREQYSARDDAVGRTIRIEGRPFTIVGVAPDNFKGLGITNEPDILLPLTVQPLLDDGPLSALLDGRGFWVYAAGRLRPGVTVGQASAALQAAWDGLKRLTVPPSYAGAQRDRFMHADLHVFSGAHGFDFIQQAFARPLAIVFALTSVILILACLNLASLSLSRAALRGHELVVRRALGATRWAAFRPLFCENLLLAIAASAAGVWLGMLGSAMLAHVLLEDAVIRVSLAVSPDGHLVAYASSVALGAALLCSVAPGWLAWGSEGGHAISKRHTRGVARAGSTGSLLIGVQVSLSVVLVVSCGLLVRTLIAIRQVPSGIESSHVVVAYPSPRPNGYASVDNDRYYPVVLERIRALAGVNAAAIALGKPAGGSDDREDVWPAGAAADSGRAVTASSIAISPGFFNAMGITRIAGRDFAWRDNSRSSRVAIISETLAKRLGTDGAVGARVRIGTNPADSAVAIIGVVRDVHLYDLRDSNLAAVYVAALQQPYSSWKSFVIRGAAPSTRQLNALLDSFGYELVTRIESLDHITDRVLLTPRLLAALGTALGGLALLLAAIGLFGLMAYIVAARRRELGIRVALGADRPRILRQVVAQALRLSLTSAAIGLCLAWFAASFVRSLLSQVSVHDPLVFATAPLTLVIVAVLAAYGPAWTAASTDPLIALRAE